VSQFRVNAVCLDMAADMMRRSFRRRLQSGELHRHE
jgi:hypothetical protein